MQAVTPWFHMAVQQNEPQSVCLRFSDDVFTNADIDITGSGMVWQSAFCNETDIKIGATMCASLNCDLLNEDLCLRDYSFGEFEAWLGVRIDHYAQNQMTLYTGPIEGYTYTITLGEGPNWILKQGTALSEQPDFEPISLIVDNTLIYAISSHGDVWRYDLANNEIVTGDLTEHMGQKALNFAKRRVYADWRPLGSGIVWSYVWDPFTKVLNEYEYCRLGIFEAARPAKLQDATVSMGGDDRMVLFEKHLGSELTIPSGGITFQNLLAAICSDVGVTLNTTTFTNGTLVYNKSNYDTFKNATYREIIGWIAEAAGAVARMTRDGCLEFAWFNNTSLVLDGSKYTEAAVYSYQVGAITKTQIYSDSGEVTQSSE